MVNKLTERVFNPGEPVYARRAITANGHKFNPGDVFDWRKMAVNQRRVRQLFDDGKLTHARVEPVAVAVAEPVAVAVVEPVTVAEQDDLDLIDDMKELRRIADEIGAPYKVSKADQRDAIRAHRKETE